jgi:hypothetical protein
MPTRGAGGVPSSLGAGTVAPSSPSASPPSRPGADAGWRSPVAFRPEGHQATLRLPPTKAK